MLFLLSIVLVIAALVLLILGLIADNGLSRIYAAIIVAALAGIALGISVLLDRRKHESKSERPTDLPGDRFSTGTGAPPEVLATSGAGSQGAATRPQAAVAPAPSRPATPPPTPAPDQDWAAPFEQATDATAVAPVATPAAAPTPAPRPAAVAAPVPAQTAPASDDDWADEDFFPIADYDDLNVEEILPLLPQLYPEELPVVEGRERATKNRAVILDTLADLAAEFARSEPAAGQSAAPAAPRGVTSGTEDLPFPIEGYDSLTAGQIVPLLGDLEPDELEEVRAHEAGGAGRHTILVALDRRLGRVAKSPPAKQAATRRAAATKKSARSSKKGATNRAPAPSKAAAGKAATQKKAAPTKKSAATQVTARQAGAPAKNAPAKRTPAKRQAAPAKKAIAKKAIAKKATGKKAARPAKRATKRR